MGLTALSTSIVVGELGLSPITRFIAQLLYPNWLYRRHSEQGAALHGEHALSCGVDTGGTPACTHDTSALVDRFAQQHFGCVFVCIAGDVHRRTPAGVCRSHGGVWCGGRQCHSQPCFLERSDWRLDHCIGGLAGKWEPFHYRVRAAHLAAHIYCRAGPLRALYREQRRDISCGLASSGRAVEILRLVVTCRARKYSWWYVDGDIAGIRPGKRRGRSRAWISPLRALFHAAGIFYKQGV